MSFENWQVFPLEDCMEAIIDYRGKTPRKSSFGIPLITAKIVKGGRILEPTEFIPFEDYDERMQRGIPRAGDVVITTEGPLGEVGQLDDRKVSVGQRLITLRGKSGLLDNTYLKYLMMSEFVQNQLLARATGTTVAGIKQAELRRIDLLIPPLPIQLRIADILSTLDSKIGINQQTNTILEAIAQTLFKEWFVDFRFHGATGQMVESELGMIPHGWRTGKLGEVCQLAKGVSYKSDELEASRLALVTLKSINRGGGFNFDGFKEYTGRFKQSQVLEEGNLVFAQTDITQNADIIGSPAIVENPFDYELLVASLDIVKCEPTNDFPSSEVLFHFLKSQDFKDYCLSHTNGSTVLHLRTSEVPNYPLVIPNKDVLVAFDRIAKPIREIIICNNRQSHFLERIRNSLLPKLLSREIEV
jgi:type I restriction enzyme S subunit